MKLSLALFGGLFASTALAGNSPHKRNVFNKVKPTLEKRVAGEQFKHPELQKRATKFLTDKTQGKSNRGRFMVYES
jgi:carboxypeptidase D